MEVDSLEVKVTSSAQTAEKGLDNLAATLGKIGAAMKGVFAPTDEFGKRFAKMGETMKQAADEQKKMFSGLEAVKFSKELGRVDTEIDKTEAKLSDLWDRMDTLKTPVSGVFGNSGLGTLGSADEIEDVSRRIAELDHVRAMLEEQRNTLWAGVEQPGAGIGSEVQDAAQKLAACNPILAQFGELAGGVRDRLAELGAGAASAAAGAFQKLGAAAKSAGAAMLDQFKKPFEKAAATLTKWQSAIGRIVFYRAIRAAIRLVVDGIKEGVKNLYNFSTLAGGQFSAAMDSLASSSLYLKNSLGAMAAPLLQAVAPAVDFLIGKFVDLTNIIGSTFAALTGQTTFTKAVKTGAKFGGDLAGAMGGAADSAKEMQKMLLGIDELNVLPDQNSGAAGGAGGIGQDYGSMFETVEISAGISDFAEKIKDAIRADDWFSVGALLGEKLNEVVANFDALDFGRKLGTQVTHGLQAAYGFLSTFSFYDLAAKVAELFNGAFETIDFETAGRVLVRWITRIPDMLLGFVTTLDFGLVARGLSDSIKGAFNELTTWMQGYNWAELGSTVWQKIKDAVTNIDYAGIASAMFTALGTEIRSALQFLGGFFGSVGADIKRWWNEDIKGESWEDTAGNLLSAIGQGFVDIGGWAWENIVEPLCSALLGADVWADVKEAGTELLNGLKQGITEALGDPGGWLKEHLVNPITNGVKPLFGIASPSTVFAEIGGFLVEGLHDGMAGKWDTITGLVSLGWDAVKGSTETAWDGLTGWLGGTWDTISGKASGTWDDITGAIGSAWAEISGNTSTTAGSVRDIIGRDFETARSSIAAALNSARATASTVWANIQTNTATANSNMQRALASAWANMTQNTSAALRGLASTVTGTFSGLASSALSWGSDLVGNIARGITSGISAVTGAASSLAEKIRGYLHFSAPDVGPLKDFDTYMPDMLREMAGGIRGNADTVVSEVYDLAANISDAMRDAVNAAANYSVGEYTVRAQYAPAVAMAGYGDGYELDGVASDYMNELDEGGKRGNETGREMVQLMQQMIALMQRAGNQRISIDGREVFRVVQEYEAREAIIHGAL